MVNGSITRALILCSSLRIFAAFKASWKVTPAPMKVITSSSDSLNTYIFIKFNVGILYHIIYIYIYIYIYISGKLTTFIYLNFLITNILNFIFLIIDNK